MNATDWRAVKYEKCRATARYRFYNEDRHVVEFEAAFWRFEDGSYCVRSAVSNMQTTGDFDESERVLVGYFKFDACCNYQFWPDDEDVPAHACIFAEIKAIFDLFREIYLEAHRMLAEAGTAHQPCWDDALPKEPITISAN